MAVYPSTYGFVTVTTPGTSVQLVTSRRIIKQIRLEPRRSATVMNLGNVYVGAVGLTKNMATTIFAVLSPEQTDGVTLSYLEADLSGWYVDADNAGDGVLVGYLW